MKEIKGGKRKKEIKKKKGGRGGERDVEGGVAGCGEV